ncbi:class F sortase [Actinoplanes solisilvae]|uniref:class F sortase n=1 Tax=Actinoplanes solisilvae TaxID=2486853 RepID=UPI000FD7A3E8|nr:class F sortase [Actinoplanes solisilvae]
MPGRTVAEAALAGILAVSGTALTVSGVWAPSPVSAPPAAAVPYAAAPSADVPPAAAPPAAAPPLPVGLDIPVIKVRTSLLRLGLRDDGTVDLPPLDSAAPAGWYRHGAPPGSAGAAVILGHVDSAKDGPAVFYRLRELKPGATVRVRRADGSTAVFTVTRKSWYRKTAFPALEVYGPTDHASLRLVTCGGGFDRGRRSYRDNLVVYADLSHIIEPGPTRRPREGT